MKNTPTDALPAVVLALLGLISATQALEAVHHGEIAPWAFVGLVASPLYLLLTAAKALIPHE